MMTAMFRLKLTMKSTPKAECTKILKSQFYQRVWSAQLNEAEYAPLLTAVLLYLNSEGVAAPLASTLAVGGQVIYFWLRAFVGHYHEGGMDPPPYAPFAVVRYVALGLLVQELRGLTAEAGRPVYRGGRDSWPARALPRARGPTIAGNRITTRLPRARAAAAISGLRTSQLTSSLWLCVKPAARSASTMARVRKAIT